MHLSRKTKRRTNPPGPVAGRRAREGGFMLLEVILAVSLLSVIAVSLTVALSKLGESAIASQREMSVLRNLESLMTEALRNPEIEPQEAELDPDPWGVSYKVLIEEMVLENENGQELPDMFRIEIKAVWEERGIVQEEVVTTYRHGPLYQINTQRGGGGSTNSRTSRSSR